MTQLALSILILLSLLQIKHMFADYFLQTRIMLEGRGAYLHLGRALHALVHAVGSLICLVFLGTPPWLTLALVAAEWIAHFHIDWGKAAFKENKAYGPADAGFWRAFGVDQLLHQLTYVAMVAVWVVFI